VKAAHSSSLREQMVGGLYKHHRRWPREINRPPAGVTAWAWAWACSTAEAVVEMKKAVAEMEMA
jgi:hypothetical protein